MFYEINGEKLKTNHVDVALYCRPAFDLFDIAIQKVIEGLKQLQLECYNHLDSFCSNYIKAKDSSVIYQVERTNTDCIIISETVIYRLFQNGKLSKVKIIALVDLTTCEKSSLFQEDYDVTECYCVEYHKVQSIYDNFGVEMTQTIQQYKQLVPSKTQVKEMMKLFPLDPNILQLPCTSEIKMNRTINFGIVNMQIYIPQISSISYFCEYALQLQTPNDLLHFHLLNPYFPMQVVNHLWNQKPISDKGIVPYTEIEKNALKKNVINLVQQLPNTKVRTHLLEYIQKEPTYDSEQQLKATLVKSL